MLPPRVVGVMDREADIFELFEHQRQDPRVELLVRAKTAASPASTSCSSACARRPSAPGCTWGAAHAKTSKAQDQTQGASGRGQPALRAHRLTPSASEFKDREPLALWCVHVAKALEWFWTLPVQSREDAERNALRWRSRTGASSRADVRATATARAP